MAGQKEFALMTFANIAGGALPERLAKAMEELLKNYRDVNVDAEGAREIMIRLRFAGNEKRDKLTVAAAITTKLPGLMHVEDIVYLAKDKTTGQLGAYTFDPGQSDMFASEAQADVLPLTPPTATGAH